jgi:hypothetical protein
MSPEEWQKRRVSVCRLLSARKQTQAAKLLEKLPFELINGTNWFRDEFCLLYWSAPLEHYTKAAEWSENPAYQQSFSQIAEAITEVGTYIRFIVVELNTEEGPSQVMTPSLQITSDVVDRALRDAENLIHTSGATSGLDRVHTGLHGYLKAACDKYTIAYPKDPSITALFKLLREQHRAFQVSDPQDADIDRIIKALAVVIDALNPLRNRGSMAHANEKLLKEPEAMLAINCVRTLISYLDAKLR